MQVLSLTCSQDQDGFGSSILVSDHGDSPGECKIQTVNSSSWDFYCIPICSGNKMVQQYLPGPVLCTVSSCP